MEHLIEVKLAGVVMDPVSKAPVMILKPHDEDKLIPIWIGEHESDIIMMELEGISPPRPMTHDLIGSMLFHLKGEVKKVVIKDVTENTYYADLYLCCGERTVILDCRPSDAVAIALKCGAEILITNVIYETSIMSEFFTCIFQDDEKVDNWFESLSLEDIVDIEQ